MVAPNPPRCAAELVLPEGSAWCELPAGHLCPHRASGPPHCPPSAEPVSWEIETPWRCIIRRGPDALGAA